MGLLQGQVRFTVGVKRYRAHRAGQHLLIQTSVDRYAAAEATRLPHSAFWRAGDFRPD